LSGFWVNALADPDRVALVGASGEEHTAGGLHERANRLVGVLRTLGLAQGDSLAVLLPNTADFIVASLATAQAGMYLTVVNTHLVGREVAYILQDSGSRALLAHQRFGDVVTDALAALDDAPAAVAVGEIEGLPSLDDLLDRESADPPVDRSTGSVMLYTSGTTGFPKGVRRRLPKADPDTAGALAVLTLAPFGAADADGVYLTCGPLYHAAPFAFTNAAVHAGQLVVLTDKWDAGEVLTLIGRHGVTATHVVPTMLRRLLDLPDEVRAAGDVSSMRAIVHAAAPCPIDVKQKMIEWIGPIVHEYYGSSEAGLVSLVLADQWLTKPGTVGPPFMGAQVRVVDDDGNACPPGEPGTLYVKTPGSFEYHNDPAKTAASRGDDGYFTVGDAGYLDEDGWLFLCDRKADMIISGGVNIYPAEIEAVLLAHAAVHEAAVLGLPDDEWGERVVGVVELTDIARADDEEAVRASLDAHCRANLAGFKCPSQWVFHDALPRQDTGKLAKRVLRAELAEGVTSS
jgi:long-chain acyl-CoA synthetase